VRSIGIGGGIDVSSRGTFADVLPVRGDTLQDLVDSYEALERAVETWPTCPSAASLDGRDGFEYRYCVQQGTSARTQFPNLIDPEYPHEWDRQDR
jgi:hypothetical protein